VSSRSENQELQAEVDLLVEFVNTHDLEEETDAIADPASLRTWIADHAGDHLLDVDEDDQKRLLDLREALRALLRINNGAEAEERELLPLREAAERSRYRLSFGEQGRLSLAPARADLGGFEARLLLAIERLQCEDAWPRLKACTDEGCQWAFYDATRNRSRTWCSMDVCGNREKTKRYRQRKSS
jgi:predicted RNA-binding Zn ribbon-like protein